MSNNLQLIKSESFGNIQADIYSNGDEMFMTTRQLYECLEESKGTFDSRITRNPYLKEAEFSATCKLQAPDGKRYDTRVFNEDGIYEITMLSESPKAKQFRSWIRKLLKSLRKGEAVLTSATELERLKIQAQQDRARAMLLNAQNRTLKTLMTAIPDKKLSPIAIEVFGLKAIEEVSGINMGNYLPKCEKTFSATEIGERLNISSKKVGILANRYNLKTDEFGVTVMDKSPHSNKEVSNFRYYEKVMPVLKAILEQQELA